MPAPKSLSLFMYREPKAAKRLFFDVIPRHMDEYQQFLRGYQTQGPKERLANPVWHIHSGNPPQSDMPVTFQLLLTLVSSSNAENAETLWGFIRRYRPGVTPKTHPKLDAMVGYAIHYFRDFVLPTKKFREPTDQERAALTDLRDALSQLKADASAENIQDVVYEIGRREPFLDKTGKIKTKDGKPGVALDWFNMLYQVLLGQEKGPRFGSFVAVYGLKNTIDMIDGALARSALIHLSCTQTIRATHSTSDVASVRSGCVALSDCSSSVFGGLACELLDHHLAVFGLDHHAVAAPHLTRRRNHDHVALAVDRLHRRAGNLQRIGMCVIDRGQRDLVPALADRKPAIVEITARAGFGEPDQRHRLRHRPHAVVDQRNEGLEARAGGVERLGYGLGRGPARPAVGRDALGLVEGGRVEPGALGKARSREPGARRQPVERQPDLGMGEHRSGGIGHGDANPVRLLSYWN